jgi:hypothetical protein
MEESIAASRVKLGLCVHLYGGLASWRMGDEPRRAETQEEVRACVYYRCHFLGWGLRTGGGIRFDSIAEAEAEAEAEGAGLGCARGKG